MHHRFLGIDRRIINYIILIFSTAIFLFPLQGECIPTDDGMIDSTKHMGDHDWAIANETTINNKTVVLERNLTILDGGKLILNNVLLKMNASSDGRYGILVMKEGNLLVYNSNITAFTDYVDNDLDFSLTDHSEGESSSGFHFKVYGSFEFINSELSYVWSYRNDNLNHWEDSFQGGVEIYSSKVSILNCSINTTNTIGINVISSSPQISNNMFYAVQEFPVYSVYFDFSVGILCKNASLNIDRSTFVNNDYGIILNKSSIDIINNTFTHNYHAIQCKYSELRMYNNEVNGLENLMDKSDSICLRSSTSDITFEQNKIFNCDTALILFSGKINITTLKVEYPTNAPKINITNNIFGNGSTVIITRYSNILFENNTVLNINGMPVIIGSRVSATIQNCNFIMTKDHGSVGTIKFSRDLAIP